MTNESCYFATKLEDARDDTDRSALQEAMRSNEVITMGMVVVEPLPGGRDKKNSYLFSIGNSTDEPIGFCVRVFAPTAEVALTKIRKALWDQYNDQAIADVVVPGLEYCTIYVNPDAITIDDIEESETVCAD